MLLPFPRESQMARALFAEAARHLQDARILHSNKRYAGSITSTMKAVELGLKSVLVLYGATGWLDPVLHSHNVFAEIIKLPTVTQSFLNALENYDSALLDDLKLLEQFIPAKPDVKKLTYAEAANTEYPFFAFMPGSMPSASLTLYSPGEHFTQAESVKHFQTAYRLLTALMALSPEIKNWKVRLCRNL